MCERTKGEPLVAFWFRQFKEEPLRVMIVFTTAAMVWLYQDGNARWEQYRVDMREQQSLLVQQITKTTEVLHKVEERLSVCDNRLHHVERELESRRNK